MWPVFITNLIKNLEFILDSDGTRTPAAKVQYSTKIIDVNNGSYPKFWGKYTKSRKNKLDAFNTFPIELIKDPNNPVKLNDDRPKVDDELPERSTTDVSMLPQFR